ncbi:MAG: hypothetical protein R3E97_24430 [Candidatus Eisenbacteria bacterium]
MRASRSKVGSARRKRTSSCSSTTESTGPDGRTLFLLVPEVTNVDNDHREKLAEATEDDVHLSPNSPLVDSVLGAEGHRERDRTRAADVRGPVGPGSFRPKVSRLRYRVHEGADLSRIPQLPEAQAGELLAAEKLSDAARIFVRDRVLAGRPASAVTSAAAATVKLGSNSDALTAVCCKSGIIDYADDVARRDRRPHLRPPSFPPRPGRPHMFLRELALYIDYLRSGDPRR